jgi:hypothetical protein
VNIFIMTGLAMGVVFKERLNRGDWQKPIFAHLVIFFKPYSSRAKAGFKESPSG